MDSEQKPVDVIMNERRDRWAVLEKRDRDRRACDWRRARRQLDGYPTPIRSRLLRRWNADRGFPGRPDYRLMMLNMFEHDRLDFDAPGQLSTAWPPTATPVDR